MDIAERTSDERRNGPRLPLCVWLWLRPVETDRLLASNGIQATRATGTTPPADGPPRTLRDGTAVRRGSARRP